MEEKSRYIVVRMNDRVYSFLMQDRRAVAIHCDPTETEEKLLLGSIYIAKVKDIVKNIGAAFVEISPGQICYLPLEDLKHPLYTKKGQSARLQQGDELLVQISREAIKTKAPSVTTNISIQGKYLVLTSGNSSLSVSKKIQGSRREELQNLIREIRQSENETPSDFHKIQDETIMDIPAEDPMKKNIRSDRISTQTYGILVRTNALEASEEQIYNEYETLKGRYHRIISIAGYRTCYSCLQKPPARWLGRLNNLYENEYEEIVTDDPVFYEDMKQYLETSATEILPKLRFYKSELLPLYKLYSLETQLKEALQERVWLRSGAYLVIQPTEALTVIDVNTGKCDTGKDKESVFLKINLEAATEIALQIRLRNMSGIIIADFINMKNAESEQKLLSDLGKLLKRDPVKCSLIDMTSLGLVEITRMKQEKPLAEEVFSGNKQEEIL